MSYIDRFYRLDGSVKGKSGHKYLSLPTESGSLRHTLPHYLHQNYTHQHHHLLKLILFSIALTGGCLCYLTIYYQLTTLVATEPETDLVYQNSNQNPSTPLVSSPTDPNSPKTNFSGNYINSRQQQQTINTLQLDVSGSANTNYDDQISNDLWLTGGNSKEVDINEILVNDINSNNKINNNIDEESSLTQKHQNEHVSEYLSEHVQLLAVKAAHRLEMLLHNLELMLTEIKLKQFSINTCPKVNVFLLEYLNSSTLQKVEINSNFVQFSPPFFKLHFPTAQTTSTLASTVTSNATLFSFSPCDVFLFLSHFYSSLNNIKQKQSFSATIAPLVFQQQIFFSNRAFIDKFHSLENFVLSQPNLCELFKTIQSFSVFNRSNVNSLLFHCDFLNTTFDNQPTQIYSKNSSQSSTYSEVILITSLNPLRAFTYQNTQKLSQKMPVKLQNSIQLTLLQTLVLLDISEQILPENKENENKDKNEEKITFPSTNHFHLLTFDFEILNEDKVTLLNVTNYNYLPNFENSTTTSSHPLKYILNDVLKLLCASTPENAIFQLKFQLERLLRNDELGLQGVNCHQSHLACLSLDDLHYLLDTLAQTFAGDSSNFKLLYPPLSLNDDETVNRDSSIDRQLEKLFEEILLHLADHQKQKMSAAPDSEQLDEFYSSFKSSKYEYQTERMYSIMSMLDFKTILKKENFETPKSSTEDNLNHKNNQDQHNIDHNHNHNHHDLNYLYDLTNLNLIYHENDSKITTQHAPPFGSDQNKSTTNNCTTNLELLPTLARFTVFLPSYINLDPPLPHFNGGESVDEGFSFGDHQHYFSSSILQTHHPNHHQHYHYQANGPANYRDLLLSLDIAVAHCDVWIKLEDRVLFQTGILNFTLGLGENVITFSLVTMAKEDVKKIQVITTYTITVHRLSREEQYYSPLPPQSAIRSNDKSSLKEICSLSQDCEMAVFGENVPCGLRQTGLKITNNDKWTEKIVFDDDHNLKQKFCTDGASSGHWLVPCYSCDKESTCSWANIKWRPTSCRYQIPVSQDRLETCFKTRKHLLIIGDSTNRGIMNYLVERLNGSLTDADKTHNLKQYQFTLNELGNKTNQEMFKLTVTFAYYPKFWIPLQKRSSFAEVLHSLLSEIFISNEKNFNFKEGEDLVIIVGGVQWIAQKHLFILQEQIQFFNISKARIVIKSLGSGFHQPVNGVHFMPLSEQKKLAVHNEELIETARQLNFGVVDTFNKTIALYRDFYPGKCACHFHKIVSKPFHQGQQNQQFYHVRGRLNHLYSEILLSEVCK